MQSIKRDIYLQKIIDRKENGFVKIVRAFVGEFLSSDIMTEFRGLDDIYAKRWYSEKSDKSGYQPICGNEWNNYHKSICYRRGKFTTK